MLKGRRPWRERGTAGQHRPGPNLWTMENWRADLLGVRTKGRAGVGRPRCTSSFLSISAAAAHRSTCPASSPPAQAAARPGWRPHLSRQQQESGDPLRRARKQGSLVEGSQKGPSPSTGHRGGKSEEIQGSDGVGSSGPGPPSLELGGTRRIRDLGEQRRGPVITREQREDTADRRTREEGRRRSRPPHPSPDPGQKAALF